MFNKVITGLIIIIILLIGMFIYVYFSIESDKTTTWEYHEDIEEAGWNPEALEQARRYYESINSTAAMAIYQGKVLFSWGDTTKSTNAHSVRKSFLSALIGIERENNGTFHLNHTLEDYNIDDHPPLNAIEKQAQFSHLMTSTSGVYLPAGEESWGMRRARPNRGANLPGEFYYYNNWDFNVLGTIYNEKTERDLFEDFKEKIAEPTGMEDFEMSHTHYSYENRRSRHPSYLFRMSARDFARFGQLYLQEGKWEGRQVVPENWVKNSTTAHAGVPSNNIFDYGYLWWVATEPPFSDLGMYSAVGRYGQSIDVIPELDLVFVHRVDSNRFTFNFTRSSVNDLQRLQLLQLIIDAKRSS
ncbi:beta-lactamase family protein [Salipaludibacillus sp. CUR1]|uniref:serine hydrolase domain-containing protein n=1 Tax=Salipaludibacillus sp. CUR1 TaxID=2820003 RepID=UPI001E539CF4|nr:serine hydrolase [Salipaludibacillus sp. CUR1]MCE7791940.1 beta-lactamase family protein [Salipaludibacillus sp. CUR1]